MLQYQKRKLDYYLKTYNKNTLQTSKSVSKPYELDAYQLKILSLKQRKAQEEIMNQQLKYYITLREKKVSYVKHVHKLIEKL